MRMALVKVVVNCSCERDCEKDGYSCSNCEFLINALDKQAGNYRNYGMLNVVAIQKAESAESESLCSGNSAMTTAKEIFRRDRTQSREPSGKKGAEEGI